MGVVTLYGYWLTVLHNEVSDTDYNLVSIGAAGYIHW